MKIEDNTPVSHAGTARRKAASSGAAAGFEGFLDAAGSTASGSSASAEVAGIGSLDGMLALQGISPEEARKRETVRQGHSLLDALEALRSSLLAGRVPPEVILELGARLARQRTEISDPKLLEIMDDIELRVAVEKAKLELAAAQAGIVL
jgi:hypothetical protein